MYVTLHTPTSIRIRKCVCVLTYFTTTLWLAVYYNIFIAGLFIQTIHLSACMYGGKSATRENHVTRTNAFRICFTLAHVLISDSRAFDFANTHIQ